jgi:hypothetical protein
MKWSIDQIEEWISTKPFILQSKEFISTKAKLCFKCLECGDSFHATFANVLRGSGCPRLDRRLQPDEKKCVIDLIENTYEIEFQCEDARGRARWKCVGCGHIWARGYFLSKGHGRKKRTRCIRCFPEVKARKWDIESVIENLRSRAIGVELVSTEYVSVEHPLDVKCSTCKYMWSSTWNVLRRVKGCPQCLDCKKLTRSDIEHKIANSSLTILPTTEPSNDAALTWLCTSCGAQRIAKWNQVDRSMKRGSSGCYSCEGKTRWSRRKIQELLDAKNAKITVLAEYVSSRTPLRVSCCVCAHIWFSSPASLIARNKGCHECNTTGKVEKSIRRFLSLVFGQEFRRTRPEWLRSDRTRGRLEIDCLCEVLNLAVEVDGPHHRRYNRMFHKTLADFEYRILCDKIKREIIQARGIRFVCVELSKNSKPIDYYKQRLKDDLTECGVKIPTAWDQTPMTVND